MFVCFCFILGINDTNFEYKIFVNSSPQLEILNLKLNYISEIPHLTDWKNLRELGNISQTKKLQKDFYSIFLFAHKIISFYTLFLFFVTTKKLEIPLFRKVCLQNFHLKYAHLHNHTKSCEAVLHRKTGQFPSKKLSVTVNFSKKMIGFF